VKGFVNDPADLFTPPRADRQWRYIVMHHSAHDTGSFAQIDRDHRERLGTAGCGYHFVVGNGSQSPDGQIEVATRWSEQKAGQHCRDSKLPEINEYGIGICLIGDLDNGQPSERQVAATRALVTYLQDRYGIPKENVVTHDRASRTATSCPGRNFPSQAVLATGRGNSSRQLASN
jgi:N-acetyl-anhydromuramyl-L-alanine amidase AmpD